MAPAEACCQDGSSKSSGWGQWKGKLVCVYIYIWMHHLPLSKEQGLGMSSKGRSRWDRGARADPLPFSTEQQEQIVVGNRGRGTGGSSAGHSAELPGDYATEKR